MLLDELKKRDEDLNKLVKFLQKMKHEELGRLCVSQCRNAAQYYYVAPGDDIKHYLKKDELDLARKIAQQDYNEQLLRDAIDEHKKVKLLRHHMEKHNLEENYDKLVEGRKNLVTPYVLSFEEYAKNWLNTRYDAMPKITGEILIKNSKGEEMRSKSECIISEILRDLGVPYKHDYPVKLADGSRRYVDFVVLNKRTRRTKYFEHFGMMNRPDYVEKMLQKIDEYAKVGIILGGNFFYTHERENEPLDIGLARKIIEANCC